MKRSIRNNRKPPGVKTAAIYSMQINIFIYLLFLIMLIYGRNAVIPGDEPHPPHPTFGGWMMVFGVITTYIYLFSLFCINFSVLKRENIGRLNKTVVSILLSVLFTIIWNRLTMAVQGSLFDLPRPDMRALRGSMMRDTVLGGLVVFTSQLIFVNYRRQMMAIENEALKAEYERARYEALKNQIDPHFLFNALNTLNSIVAKDTKQAREFIQKLSSIFRYTMHSKDVTRLEDELAFTKAYCDLMQIRYGDNIEFRFDILEKYNSYHVVPFSIQTLIENAVKHNVITNNQKLVVDIYTDADSTVTVSNMISPKIEQEAADGIGLANLSERYKLKWGEEILIRNDGSTFSVRLPLIHESKEVEK